MEIGVLRGSPLCFVDFCSVLRGSPLCFLDFYSRDAKFCVSTTGPGSPFRTPTVLSTGRTASLPVGANDYKSAGNFLIFAGSFLNFAGSFLDFAGSFLGFAGSF
jgi:hypothetical protein